MKKIGFLIITDKEQVDPASKDYLEDFRWRIKPRPESVVRRISVAKAAAEAPLAVESFAAKGIQEVLVMPARSIRAALLKDFIPEVIGKMRRSHPEIDFHYPGLIA